MEPSQNKTFIIKTLTIGRGSSRQRGGRWEKIDIQLAADLLPETDVDEAKLELDGILKSYITEWQNEPLENSGKLPIHWMPRTGSKGPFEFASEKMNVNSQEFFELQQRLKNAGNSLTEGNYYVWLFQDQHNIGRKVRSD